KPGMVLDVKDARSEDFTPIQLYGAGDQAGRRWRLVPIGGSQYLIETALKPGVVLDVREARAEKGAIVQLGGGADRPQGRGSNRCWRLVPAGAGGEYRIESILKEGLVLEVKEGRPENHTPIQMGEWANQPGQRWRLIRVDLGKPNDRQALPEP